MTFLDHHDLTSGEGNARAVDSAAPTKPGPSDQELLAEYAASQSEAAFAELVRRHTGLVWASALRQVGNQTVAEEITQAVFIVLARKASSLTREVALTGWLFRATRYAALDAQKTEGRRQRRELEAAQMEPPHSPDESEPAWDQITPLIDDALAALGSKDRNAILLRFFEEKSFHEIGAALGTNDNAARARVVRALDKLRKFFCQRGVILTAGLVTGALLSGRLTAAPTGLRSTPLVGGTMPPLSEVLASRVQALAHRLFQRQMARVTAVVAVTLALGIALTLLTVSVRGLAERAATAKELRKLVQEVDAAYSFDDAPALLARIHFRSDEEVFRPALANYVRTAAEFRQAASKVLRDPTNSLRAFTLTLEPLVAGQPTNHNLTIAAGHAMVPWLPEHSLAMIQVDGRWKWDCLGPLSPKLRDHILASLAERTRRLDELTWKVRSGQMSRPDRLLEALVAVVRGTGWEP